MPTNMDEFEPDFDEEIDEAIESKADQRKKARLALFATLEPRLGIPIGFVDDVFREPDDWAYIIKIAVLCEAAVTHALTITVGNAKTSEHLQEHFADIPNSRRLQLAVKLGILSKEDMHSLDAVAQVRNAFAHRVENIDGSLEAFFDKCSPDKKVELIVKMLQRKGKEKPKATDDLKGFNRVFKLMIALAALNPLKSIAYYGLEAVKRADEEKKWGTRKGSIGIIASAMQAEPSAEMYREKLVR